MMVQLHSKVFINHKFCGYINFYNSILKLQIETFLKEIFSCFGLSEFINVNYIGEGIDWNEFVLVVYSGIKG